MLDCLLERLQNSFPLGVVVGIGTPDEVEGLLAAEPQSLEQLVEGGFTDPIQPGQDTSYILQSPACLLNAVAARRLMQNPFDFGLGRWLTFRKENGLTPAR